MHCCCAMVFLSPAKRRKVNRAFNVAADCCVTITHIGMQGLKGYHVGDTKVVTIHRITPLQKM